jgi:hypothetical protein
MISHFDQIGENVQTLTESGVALQIPIATVFARADCFEYGAGIIAQNFSVVSLNT